MKLKKLKVLHLCLSEEWSTLERMVLRNCLYAQNSPVEPYIYCLRDTYIDHEARKNGIPTYSQLGTVSSSLQRFKGILKLSQFLQKENIDIVHFYEFNLLLPICFMLRRYPIIPLFFTSQQEIETFYSKFWYRTLISRIDTSIALNSEISENLKNHLRIPARKIEVTGMGMNYLDIKHPHYDEKFFSQFDDCFLIGAYISPSTKDLTHILPIIKALSTFNTKFEKPCQLVLFTNENWKKLLIYSELQAVLKDTGEDQHILFIGEGDFRYCQKFLDLWIQHNPREIFEDYMISSIYFEVPVLAIRSPSSKELVRELGVVGETYKYGDAREMRDKLALMFESYEKYKNGATVASSIVEENYGAENYWQNLEKAYEMALLKRRRFLQGRA